MMMKWLGMVALAAGMTLSLVPEVADAKRLGGARSSGLQRTAPDRTPQSPPAATPNPGVAAPAAAGAAAGKRSWMGPVAGLAAGLGLAALFSHLGLGEELANFVMLALLALAVVVAVRLLLRRGSSARAPAMAREGLATAGAGASGASAAGSRAAWVPQIGSGAAVAAAAAPSLPAGFDRSGFERLAKLLFIRMQAANDRADLDDLRRFTTPELYAELRLDLQERGDAAQHTDIVQVDAELIDFEQQDGRQLVSVRYTGMLREAEQAAGDAPQAFDEVWHLVKPSADDAGWAIAGIQQRG